MKYFLPLFIFLFTFNTFGANWYSVGEFSIEKTFNSKQNDWFDYSSADSDITPPQLISLSFNPTSINTGSSSQTVVFTLRITDDLSGFKQGNVFVTSASGQQQVTGFFYPSDRISGTSLDGIYTVNVVFPQYSESGTWRISQVYRQDLAGNGQSYNNSVLSSLGFPNQISVNGFNDVQPPILASFNLNPTLINTSSGTQTVTATLRITDNLSGFKQGNVFITSASGQQQVTGFFYPSDRISGNNLDGIYKVNIVFPQYSEAGIWRVTQVYRQDLAGNGLSDSTSALSSLGFPTQIQNIVCNFTISPTNQSIGSSGGNFQVNVIGTTGCSRTAVSTTSWINVSSGSTGDGNGIVNLSVQANTGIARNGTVTIAGQTFTVNQAAGTIATPTPTPTPQQTPTPTPIVTPTPSPTPVPCTYSLSASSASIAATGATGTFTITTSPGCNWSAISYNPWIRITSLNNGTGSGWVDYFVDPNPGEERGGSIAIAGQFFTIIQTGNTACTVIVPSSTPAFSAQATSSTFAVTANNCAWTASTTASWIAIHTPSGTGTGTVSFSLAANTGAARTGSITVNGQSFTFSQDAGAAQRRVAFDFDGDGKADNSIFRSSLGEWWYLRSSDGGNAAAQFGSEKDKIVPADYTGDGVTDMAFYRPEKGEWFILRSENFSYYAFPFGIEEDIPAPADYDGDQKADAAVYRPSTNTWYIMKSTGGFAVEQFGASGDVPVVADYNGDGRADFALYNKSTSTWKTKTANSSTVLSLFRESTQKAVPADYTGDGKADIAFYNPENGEWYIIRSENQTSYTVSFGAPGDIPAPADIDGDGKTDLVIYRPSTSTWWYSASASGGQHRATQFGISTDKPVPNVFVR